MYNLLNPLMVITVLGHALGFGNSQTHMKNKKCGRHKFNPLLVTAKLKDLIL